ncbi:MAG: hypothetical protein JW755_00745 [Candidatus Aminicenantes bacterium]|nr:hypothetical protein [Candidatus Aminicenantes bacterium]
MNQVLEILYLFTDIDILPEMDPLGLSPHLLEMYQHLWLSALQMAIKLEIAEGNFTDAADVTILLEEKYLLDYIIPSGICPNHQTTLASVIDVESFFGVLDNIFVYHSFRAIYRAESETFDEVPATHIQVPGVGINPFDPDGGWFMPNLALGDFPDGGLLLGKEVWTPLYSGYESWYNAGGQMFLILHPCLVNAVLRSNLANLGYGAAPEEIWTKKLLTTNENYPACVPDYSIFSADINEHFKIRYREFMGYSEASNSNHGRGAWSSYDWTATIGPYYWSHTNHGDGCPLACDLCYKNMIGYGDDSITIMREWVLGSYGRAGTQNRNLYDYISSIPSEYFSEFEDGYIFVDGREIDTETEQQIQNEWDSTGPVSTWVQYTHYGGLTGGIRWIDMIMLDRAYYHLSAAGVTGGAFSASPITLYSRIYRHTGNQREGSLSIGGKIFPEDYKIYPRGIGIPGGGLHPFWPSLIIGNAGLEKVGIDFDLMKTASQFGEHTLTMNNEALVWGKETISYD